MGLCKCRQVTHLFCFEHRKNVCESCLVSEHAQCIVRTYLQWLQDSEFDPSCGICKQLLSTGPTVRLTCLDIFHVSCLDAVLSKMPANTAPPGYTCPTCQQPLVTAHPSQKTSPLAIQLRESLKHLPWAASLWNTVMSAIAATTSLPDPTGPLHARHGDDQIALDLGASSRRNDPDLEPLQSTTTGSSSSRMTRKASKMMDADDNKYLRHQQARWGSLLQVPLRLFGILRTPRGILYSVFAILMIIIWQNGRSVPEPSSQETVTPPPVIPPKPMTPPPIAVDQTVQPLTSSPTVTNQWDNARVNAAP